MVLLLKRILPAFLILLAQVGYSQVLHDQSCGSTSTSFALDWDTSPSSTQVEWTPAGSTSFTASNVQGSGYSISFTTTGQTGTFATENSVSTPGITSSLSGGADALTLSSSGLNDGEEITLEMTFTPAIAGNISFDIYNVIEQSISGADPGQQVEVYALTSTGFLIIPEITDNGSPSWELEGPAILDGNASSTTGTNDQIGVNFRSIADVASVTVTMRKCSNCDFAPNTEIAISDIDFCLTPDTDQDGISDTDDEDDDNDGIPDVVERCPANDASTLDWDNYTWASGSSQTFTMPDGTGMTVSAISNGAPTVALGINSNLGGGLGGSPDGLFINGDQNAQTNSIDITFDFDQTIDSVSFTIFDVDLSAGQFTDSLIITGYFNKLVVFPTLTGSSNNNVAFNRAVGTIASNEADGDGNVGVQFSDPIDSLVIFYGNGNSAPAAPGNQWITLYDITYIGDCGSSDTDGDGIDDYLDIDADNDGIVDYIEWQGTTGTPIAPSGVDSDMDGIDNNFESVGAPVDTDGDGVPDFQDPDSDDDGDLDLLEGWDTNNSGTANTTPTGTDTDGDGLDNAFDNVNGWNSTTNVTNNNEDALDFPNLDEVSTSERDWREDEDIDNDGIQEYADIDDDNDGIPDVDEYNGFDVNGDEDGDGIPNWADTSDGGNGGDGTTSDYTDSNGDGIADVFDDDLDGVPNHRDLDSDNDGILDLYESGISSTTLASIDANGDGVIDPTQTFGTNGFDNALETGADNGIKDYTLDDTDGDGIIDSRDLDSDNDGITDRTEAGTGTDSNTDGVVDGTADLDGDGIINSADSDDSNFGSPSTTPTDTDSDGTANQKDIDSDNDGITDLAENGNGTDSDNNGVVDGSADTDGDGILDSADSDDANDGSPGDDPLDTDTDGDDNYLDIDSDNDGITDLTESGAGTDSDNDGVVDGSTDSDGDGMLDSADNEDGTFGSAGSIPTNSDSDSFANFIDIDSDDDGIIDNIEAQASTSSPIRPAGSDSDNDGLDNNFESTNGLTPVDTDSDGTPDYIDTESDGDNDLDALEGYDTDNDGTADTTPSGSDSDGDGLDNAYDDVNGWNSTTNVTNNSQDALDFPNLDEASTNERDWREAVDSDNDGTADGQDIDDDNDGVLDINEGCASGTAFSETLDWDVESWGGGTSGSFAQTNVTVNVDVTHTGSVTPTVSIGTTESGGLSPAQNSLLTTLNAASNTATFTVALGLSTEVDTMRFSLFDIDQRTSGGEASQEVVTVTGYLNGTPVNPTSIAGGSVHSVSSNVITATANSTSSTTGTADVVFNSTIDSVALVMTYGGSSATDPPNTRWSVHDIYLSKSAGLGTCTVDSDGDGIFDNLDLDSDNDGILDMYESGIPAATLATIDANGDGVIDNTQTFGTNGFDNALETSADNGTIDYTIANSDNSGAVDRIDLDSDNDGITDLVEGQATGTDSNNDGVIDGNADADGDGILNSADSDDSNAGSPSTTPVNTDGTDAYDFQDLDSDNDGIPDLTENGNGTDADNNGVVDGSTDADGDGILSSADSDDSTTGSPNTTATDTDQDGADNYIDIDSDNDGITDLRESGTGTDSNSDGVVDGSSDTDGDGILDSADSDDSTIGTPGTTATNSDSDSFPNFLDIDSDDDGIIDNIEAQATSGSPIRAGGLDSDNDGLDNNFESSNGLTPEDTESDGTPDYLDTDSDNDSTSDTIEAYDTDNDDTADTTPSGSDSDGDGLDNNFDNVNGWNATTNVSNSSQDALDFPNLDQTGTTERDWREFDDCDGDGIANSVDLDDDNDGIPDATEGSGDQDNDGIPNTCDLDSDNDGIFDIIEAGGTDSDDDGMVDGFTDVTASAGYSISTGCSSSLTTISSPTSLSLGDDETNTSITLPFDFEFFGNTISSGTTLRLNSNAWLSFDAISPGTTYNSVSYPSATYTNTIAFNHRDMTPNNNGTVSYGTNGSSPNRIFIIEFNGVSFFSENGTFTGQVQLHETTNEVRIVTTNMNADGGDDHTMGLNLDGTTAITVSGRNDTYYTITTPECQSFTYSTGTSQNGYDDNLEASPLSITNTDSDALADYLDIDSDDDGIIDLIEAQASSATPTVPSGSDSDGDGLDDSFETGGLTPVDTDSDLTPDYQDTNSDNDSFDDVLEAYDTDYNGVANTLPAGSDADGDGLDDNFDNVNGLNSTTNVTNNSQTSSDFPGLSNIISAERDWREEPDWDNDSVLDDTDIDDDNDGIPDITEAEGNEPDGDEDGDGIPNWLDSSDDGTGDGSTTDYTDANGDNIPDVYDFDSDGVPNHHDLDSDNDGITDLQESGMSSTDIAALDPNDDGIINSSNDFGTNGLANDLETSVDNGTLDYTVANTDGNGPINALDLDSENDGVLDAEENGNGTDADNDGIVDGTADADFDGILDSADSDDGNLGSPNTAATDTDGDGSYNAIDIDADNDGILDLVESGTGTDADNNGIVDGTSDADNDGIIASTDTQDGTIGSDGLTPTNTDSDAVANYLDIDSDDDGIIDNIEAQASTATPVVPGGTDSDNDGLDDNFESTTGLTPIDQSDEAGDTTPDYIDTDSDDDGESDTIEAYDSDDDGSANTVPAGSDSDGDGLDDNFDNVNGWNSTTNVTNNGSDAFDFPDHDEGNVELDWREEPCLNGDVVLAAPGTTTSAPSKCKQTPWTYYYNAAAPSELLFAIEKKPVAVGGNTNDFTAQASITVNSNPTSNTGPYPQEDLSGSPKATFVMGRYWNVDILTGSLNGTVNVRFFYDPVELAVMITQANAWNVSNSGAGSIVSSGQMWFKTVGVTFDQGVQHGSEGISNSIQLNVAATGTIDGVNYVQFDGITSFSGGGAAQTEGVNSAILPIELLYFNAVKSGDDAQLNWSTATEINNDFFTIERSVDNVVWAPIGEMDGAGTTSRQQDYEFWDLSPEAGRNYYRIKQSDFDGSSSYSEVRIVEFGSQETVGLSVQAIPNPSDGDVDIIIDSGNDKEIMLYLVDGTGKVIRQLKHRSLDGKHQMYFGELATGTYILKVVSTHFTETEKLIVH